MSEAASFNSTPPSWFRLALVVGFMWLSLGLGPMALFIPFVCIYLGILAIKHRTWTPLAALLCTPLFVLFVLGACSWHSNKPAYHFAGLPRPEAFNLKRDSRCYALSSGCIVDGSEVIINSSFNAGLWTMLTLFGWPPQTYHGPFPNENEAAQLTESGQPIPLGEFEEGIIQLQERKLQIPAETAERMLFGTHVWHQADDDSEPVRIRAGLSDNDCLLVRVSNQAGEPPMDHVYLFDSKSMKAFARYQIGNRTSTPPFFAAE